MLNIAHLVRKAQQWLHFVRTLRTFGMSTKILSKLYKLAALLEPSLLAASLWGTAALLLWTTNTSREWWTAGRTTRTRLPSLQKTYHCRFHSRAALETQRPLSRVLYHHWGYFFLKIGVCFARATCYRLGSNHER